MLVDARRFKRLTATGGVARSVASQTVIDGLPEGSVALSNLFRVPIRTIAVSSLLDDRCNDAQSTKADLRVKCTPGII